MAVTRIGAGTKSNSALANTAFTANRTQSPTATNLIILVVIARRTGADPAITTPAGFTLAGSALAAAGAGDHGLTALFYKISTGGEASPSIAYTGSSASAIWEEWNGLAASSVADGAAGSANTGVATAGAVTLTASLTTGVANSWIYAVGGTTNLAATTFTWAGGQVADFAYANVASVGIGTSTQQLVGSGVQSPALNYNRTSGTGGLVAQAFKIASVAQTEYAGILPI